MEVNIKGKLQNFIKIRIFSIMFLISMRFGQGIGNQLWLLATGLYLSKSTKENLFKNMKWFLGEK